MTKQILHNAILFCTFSLLLGSCELTTENTSYLWVTFPANRYPSYFSYYDTIGVWADGMDNVPFIEAGATETGERIYLCTKRKLALKGSFVAMFPYQSNAIMSNDEVHVSVDDTQGDLSVIENFPIMIGEGNVNEQDINCASVKLREVTSIVHFNLINLPPKGADIQYSPAYNTAPPAPVYAGSVTLRILPEMGQPINFFHKSGWVNTSNQQITYPDADFASAVSVLNNSWGMGDTIPAFIILLPDKYLECKLQAEMIMDVDASNVYVFPLEGKTFARGFRTVYDLDFNTAIKYPAYVENGISCGVPSRWGNLLSAPCNMGAKDSYLSAGEIYTDCPDMPKCVKNAEGKYIEIPAGWRKPTIEEMQSILSAQENELYLRGAVTGHWSLSQSVLGAEAGVDSLFLPEGDYLPVSPSGYLHLIKDIE